VAVSTLLALIGVSIFIDRRQADALLEVERHLVPKSELGPRLSGQFELLRRSLQDAVAAQDRAALEATSQTRDRVFELLASSGGAISSADADALRDSLRAYYDAAHSVSARLIQGETGEELVLAVADMQERHHALAELIETKTRLERDELATGFAAVRASADQANRYRIGIGLAGVLSLLILSAWTRRGLLRPLGDLSEGFARFATGDLAHRINVDSTDELGRVAREANQMAAALHDLNRERDREDWLKAGLVGLADQLRGDLEPREVTDRALSFLVRYLGAVGGAAYVLGDDGKLACQSRHAGSVPDGDAVALAARRFTPGEGLLGQSFASDDIVVVTDVPAGYVVRSGLGESPPRELVFVPLTHVGRRLGVLELAFFKPCSGDALSLLQSLRETLVVAMEVSASRAALSALLDRTRAQAERLAAQEEELRAANDDLHSQQTDLRNANEKLEEQRSALSRQNAELEVARTRVQQQVEELARVSSYKSQFLANMSHELRTPLNSMLLLSHLLSENDGGNLSDRQVEHCRTIHGAGQDLLALINQVLDLAKIEAGKQDVRWVETETRHFAEHARRVFAPMASDKGLGFVIQIDDDLPAVVTTDRPRVERILTNLLGNAIKFTDNGTITLRLSRARPVARPSPDAGAVPMLAFSVIDTGIGIAPEAIERIFEPFEQVRSETEHKAAGTGLGLAIARESATLIGGELQVESIRGRGTTFTLFLPEHPPPEVRAAEAEGSELSERAPAVPRPAVDAEAPQLLVIEDDPVLAELLSELISARGISAITASSGRDGLRLARSQRPLGIILDVKLPDITGFEVMEQLQRDPTTRGIPVHFLSAIDAAERGLALGAIGYVTKPVTRTGLISVIQTLAPVETERPRSVLVVEDDVAEGRAILALLTEEGLEAHHVANATGAFEALTRQRFGCIVLDLGLPDLDGLGLLKSIRERVDLHPPRVVVHTGRALSKLEIRELEQYAEAVVLKDGHSPERLVDEVRAFVHHLRDEAPELASLADAAAPDDSLDGKKLLLVDDDMRTVYALSAFLRAKGATVLVADTGKVALEEMAKNPDVDAILMDVMMPEMDGYEAMRRLREQERFGRVPILALTARAMKGERERCIEAGASDYLAKPVDTRVLLSTLETWLRPRDSHPGRQLDH
jgi:CheY-like chemotaxis protein/HAMP domain-containing protein